LDNGEWEAAQASGSSIEGFPLYRNENIGSPSLIQRAAKLSGLVPDGRCIAHPPLFFAHAHRYYKNISFCVRKINAKSYANVLFFSHLRIFYVDDMASVFLRTYTLRNHRPVALKFHYFKGKYSSYSSLLTL
jgi:hypothetical protein